jgi:hypothetical protein
LKVLTVFLALLAIVSAASRAQDPCYSELHVSCEGMRVSVCPRGDFEPIREGCGGSDDYIEVYVRDSGQNGISGIPWTDYWINACHIEHELWLCVQHIVADSVTGSNGRTTFSEKISAGGCIPEGGIWMAVQGQTILDPGCTVPVCVDIVFVGPDINADGTVDLSDLSFFGESYNSALGDPEFDTCCDYNDDGKCNLSDFSWLGQHYQHGCF